MPIILAVGAVLVLAIVFGPQLWIRRVLVQHGGERPDFPGTGAELARHLLDDPAELLRLGDHEGAILRRGHQARHDALHLKLLGGRLVA